MNTHHGWFRRVFAVWVLLATAFFARAAETEAEAPVLSFSLRGVADDTVEQGEPVSVVVRISARREQIRPITIAPAGGTWVDAVYVEIAKDKTAAQVARAAAVGRPDAPAAIIERNRTAGGLWLFSTATMEGLAPGDYVVRVRLKVETGTGWTGEARSNAFPLKIVAPSAAPKRVVQRALARANEAMLADRGEDAAAILDTVLLKSPDNRDVLVLRAVVAERAGNIPAAIVCVNRAARGLSAEGPPPVALHVLRTRLQAKLLEPLTGSSASQPPAWSWPPTDHFPKK